MAVELNISINEDTAQRIQKFAEKNNTSVSKIAEEQFDKLTLKTETKGKGFTEKYAGTLKHHIPDIDAARDEYLKEKYGL